MKVDLSKSEFELLDTALQKLEVSTEPELLKYAMENATILTGEAGPQSMNSAFNQIKDKVLGMLSTRRRQCTLMRAKLFQAAAAESEHDLSESPVTPPPVEKRIMNTEVYFAEVIKPGGHQTVLTVPTAINGPAPGLPVACTDRAQADAMWTSLIASIKDAPIKEGTIFRLVKFERIAELYEFVAPGSEIGLST